MEIWKWSALATGIRNDWTERVILVLNIRTGIFIARTAGCFLGTSFSCLCGGVRGHSDGGSIWFTRSPVVALCSLWSRGRHCLVWSVSVVVLDDWQVVEDPVVRNIRESETRCCRDYCGRGSTGGRGWGGSGIWSDRWHRGRGRKRIVIRVVIVIWIVLGQIQIIIIVIIIVVVIVVIPV